MKRFLIRQKGLALAVGTFLLAFALLSWDFHQPVQVFFDGEKLDTVPVKRERKVRNLDEALEELERAERELDVHLKFEWDKMEKDIEKAMKEMDMAKIRMELDHSMREIDLVKMKKELEKINEIDFEKIKKEIEKNMRDVDIELKNLDGEKIRKEIEESMARIDMEKIRKDIDVDMKKLEEEMKELKIELSNIKPEIEESLKDAREELAKVKVQIRDYKGFVDQLHEEKLIDKNKDYEIRHEDGALYINDVKQSQEVYDRHRNFLDKYRDFKIRKEANNLNLDLD